MRLAIGDRTVHTVTVDDAEISASPDGGDADATIQFERAEEVARMLRGDLNPFVAWLQDRFEIRGDLVLAVKVLVGMQAPVDSEEQAVTTEAGDVARDG